MNSVKSNNQNLKFQRFTKLGLNIPAYEDDLSAYPLDKLVVDLDYYLYTGCQRNFKNNETF